MSKSMALADAVARLRGDKQLTWIHKTEIADMIEGIVKAVDFYRAQRGWEFWLIQEAIDPTYVRPIHPDDEFGDGSDT